MANALSAHKLAAKNASIHLAVLLIRNKDVQHVPLATNFKTECAYHAKTRTAFNAQHRFRSAKNVTKQLVLEYLPLMALANTAVKQTDSLSLGKIVSVTLQNMLHPLIRTSARRVQRYYRDAQVANKS